MQPAKDFQKMRFNMERLFLETPCIKTLKVKFDGVTSCDCIARGPKFNTSEV